MGIIPDSNLSTTQFCQLPPALGYSQPRSRLQRCRRSGRVIDQISHPKYSAGPRRPRHWTPNNPNRTSLHRKIHNPCCFDTVVNRLSRGLEAWNLRCHGIHITGLSCFFCQFTVDTDQISFYWYNVRFEFASCQTTHRRTRYGFPLHTRCQDITDSSTSIALHCLGDQAQSFNYFLAVNVFGLCSTYSTTNILAQRSR
jgi:hypothetical protein